MWAKTRVETVPVSCEDASVSGDTNGDICRQLKAQLRAETQTETVPVSCEDRGVGGDTDGDILVS